jgi:hypothetical protein
MLAQGNLDFHAGIRIVAQHLDNLADGLGIAGRLLTSSTTTTCPAYGLSIWTPGRQQDLLEMRRFSGTTRVTPFSTSTRPYHPRIGALQHLDDLAFRPAAPIQPRNAHHHSIPVQNLTHLIGTKEDVGPLLLGYSRKP